MLTKVAIAYDFDIGGGLVDVIKRAVDHPPEGFVVEWAGQLDDQGTIWEHKVHPMVAQADRLVAFMDHANANVGFEVGFCLAGRRGSGNPSRAPRKIALVHKSEGLLPRWFQHHPLKGVLCSPVPHGKDLQDLIQLDKGMESLSDPESDPREPGQVLFVCPHRSGDDYAYSAQPDRRGWSTLQTVPWDPTALPVMLSNVRNVIWLIPPHSDGSPPRSDGSPADGIETACLSILAGYARGCGIRLTVFRHDQARQVADVAAIERVFGDGEDLVRQLDGLESEDEHLAKDVAPHAEGPIIVTNSSESEQAPLWEPLPREPDMFQLLSWKTRMTPLLGRDAQLSTIRSWVAAGDARPVMVMTGSGGAGKTRLAAEVCDELRTSGHRVAWLRKDADVSSLIQEDALLVVDYPEENKELVVALLGMVRDSRHDRLRVLMLSRQPRAWWIDAEVTQQFHDLFDSIEIALEPLSQEDTLAMFRQVSERVTRKYGLPRRLIAPEKVMNWRDRPDTPALPLFVAAVAVQASFDGERALDSGGGDVIQALVTRERRRLNAAGTIVGLGKSCGSRLLALAAVAGKLDVAAIRRLSDPRLELGLPTNPGEVVDAVTRFGAWKRDGIPAPIPDILAAALLNTVLAEREDVGPEWLWEVLREHKESSIDWLARLVFDTATVYGASGNRVVNQLVAMLRTDPVRAFALERFAREDRPPDSITPITIEINRQLSKIEGQPERQHARYLIDMATQLSREERRDEGVEPARRAVEIYESMDSDRSDEPSADFADALYSLALALPWESPEALEMIRRAVVIRRQLLSGDSHECDYELARVLIHQAICENSAGLLQEARRSGEESAELLKPLVASGRGQVRDALARAYHGLTAVALGQFRTEDAISLAEQGIELRRRLSQEVPWRYSRYLALSLQQRGGIQLNRGRMQDALSSFEEAASLRQSLARSNPLAFGHTLLSTTLTVQQITLGLGRFDEARRLANRDDILLKDLIEAGVPESDPRLLAWAAHAYRFRWIQLGIRPRGQLRALLGSNDMSGAHRMADPAAPKRAALLNEIGCHHENLRDSDESSSKIAATLDSVDTQIYEFAADDEQSEFLAELLADLQLRLTGPNLSDLHTRVVKMRRELLAAVHLPDPGALRVAGVVSLADRAFLANCETEVLENLRSGLEVGRRALARSHPERRPLDRARLFNSLGYGTALLAKLEPENSDLSDAEKFLREGLRLTLEHLEGTDQEADVRDSLGMVMVDRGVESNDEALVRRGVIEIEEAGRIFSEHENVDGLRIVELHRTAAENWLRSNEGSNS